MKKIIFKVLRFSGLPFLFRELIQENKVTILLFHDISKETADKIFAYLSRKYNVTALNDFIEAHEKSSKMKIPKKALIITFDDGYIRNYELLPLIKRYNIPVTIFLCASIVDTNRYYWFKFKHPSLSASDIIHKSNSDKLKILAKVGFGREKEFEKPQALTKKQIMEMKNHVNFQSHTLFHPCLPTCRDDEAKEEIVSSKKILERDYGLNINTISYPNGDYSDRDIAISKAAGYKCGITVDYGFNTMGTDLFRLKRLSVNDTNDINELIVKASGVWAFFKTINRKKHEYGYTNNIER
jgi:peptidoglycan/xylan/chitin deacetylase (PgdA/CDA1 family)